MYIMYNVCNAQCITCILNLLWVSMWWGWTPALRALQSMSSPSIPAACTPKSHTCSKQGRTQGRIIALVIRAMLSHNYCTKCPKPYDGGVGPLFVSQLRLGSEDKHV